MCIPSCSPREQQGDAAKKQLETPAKKTTEPCPQDLLDNLKKCDGGTGIYEKAKAANGGKDPTIKLGAGGQVDLKKGEITLNKSYDTCFATQQLIQELSNLSQKAAFEKANSDALAGNLSREEFIREYERIEYEHGVKNIIKAFDSCKDTWGCKTCQKEWARSAKNFDDYYNNYLSSSHKENYGQWWDANCKGAYDAKHPKK
jgi:hypothetical protein